MAIAQGKHPLSILVARPDRMGDVILSTPALTALKLHYPDSRITVLIRQPAVALIKGLPFVDDVLVYDPEGRHAGLSGFFQLVRDFRARRVRVGIVFHSNFKIAAALFAAGVRYRLGALSKPHSYLFYNRGVRQRRSHVEMHEAEYNLQILRRLGIRAGSRTNETRVAISETAHEEARRWLSAQGWQGGTKLVAVHPGMGGSALNWPEAHYVELIRALVREKLGVLVTAGEAEWDLIARIRRELGDQAENVMFYAAAKSSHADLLGAFFAQADLVVAPSTGPLHLAVALQKPVVTFYPPIRVQSALRWGPYRPDETLSGVLVPDVFCGQDFRCLGKICNYYPCMKSLGVAQALDEVHRLLALRSDGALT